MVQIGCSLSGWDVNIDEFNIQQGNHPFGTT